MWQVNSAEGHLEQLSVPEMQNELNKHLNETKSATDLSDL